MDVWASIESLKTLTLLTYNLPSKLHFHCHAGLQTETCWFLLPVTVFVASVLDLAFYTSGPKQKQKQKTKAVTRNCFRGVSPIPSLPFLPSPFSSLPFLFCFLFPSNPVKGMLWERCKLPAGSAGPQTHFYVFRAREHGWWLQMLFYFCWTKSENWYKCSVVSEYVRLRAHSTLYFKILFSIPNAPE